MIATGKIVPEETIDRLNGWSERLGTSDFISFDRIKSTQGTLVSAWILTKLTEPVRLPLAIASTPAAARKVRSVFAGTSVKWSVKGIFGVVAAVLLVEISILYASGSTLDDKNEFSDSGRGQK